MSKLIRVGITQGDYNGVGYEVIMKSLANPDVVELYTPVVFAHKNLIEKARRDFKLELPPLNYISSARQAADGQLNVVNLPGEPKLTPGEPTAASGRDAYAALEEAVNALKEGSVDVLVTAPICKSNIQGEGFDFAGHTEYLQERIGEGAKAGMILYNDRLRVMLVTTHLPVKDIAQEIKTDRIKETVELFATTLRQDFGIMRPKIAVLSLNPHAGDNGLLGEEEEKEIIPAIRQCVEEGIMAFGPMAADGFFGSGAFKDYDGVVAMYHDQGLAPFKTIAAESGVNFTAGLPFVRTSPDHGTAFDIAWKGEADETSMREAIYKAVDLWRCRKNHLNASRNPLRKVKLEKTADKTVDLTKDEE